MVSAQSSRDSNEVIIAFPAIPAHFDPMLGFGADGHGGGQRLIFSALLETDAYMNIIPGLAMGYTISEDALVYTFSLRSDARFSDSSPVTADDILFSYQTLMQNATGIDLALIERIEAQDDTVTITLSRPQSTFILTVSQVSIVPRNTYSSDFGMNPIGSGPFRLAQFDLDQQFILEANPYYHGQAPQIERAVFVRIGDEDARLASVRAGIVDIAPTSAVLAAAISDIPGYHLMIAETVDNMGIVLPTIPNEGVVNQFGFPIGHEFTYDLNFRRALAYGIDRDAIINYALRGFASPAFTENDGLPWSNPESRIEFDIEYAISLLEDSGWIIGSDGIRHRDGQRASIPLMYAAGDSARQAVAMALSQQARENLGIEIIVGGFSWDEIGRRMFSEPLMLAWGSLNPITSFHLFHSSFAGLDDFYNPQNFTNPVVDRYLELAISARTLEEAIPYFHLAQWDGTNGTSMRGDSPFIFLVNLSHLYWVRDGLDTGRRPIHAHGSSWPLVQNLREWSWIE